MGGRGWWDKDLDWPRPLLYLGDFFFLNFIVDAKTSRFCIFTLDCGKSVQMERKSKSVDIKRKVCHFDPVVFSGAVYEICSIRCTFFSL